MDVGVTIAHTARLADPGAVRIAATAAEQVGYAALWVPDRLGEGRPDPFGVLALAAAATCRIGLGIFRLDGARYRPDVLGRAVATLERASDGRLTVALVGGDDDAVDAITAAAAAGGRRPPRVLMGADAPFVVPLVAGQPAPDIPPETSQVILTAEGDPTLDQALNAYAELSEALEARC